MSNQTILVAEDDTQLRETILSNLTRENYHCVGCSDISEIIDKLDKKTINTLIININLQNSTKKSLFEIISKYHKKVAIITLANYSDVNQSISAIHHGAKDYLVTPVDSAELIEKIEKYSPNSKLSLSDDQPVFVSQRSKIVFQLAERIAKIHATVLITGESGTGKEVIAQFIHKHSHRANQPFVAINCAAIPENMLEATLFGYEKGAFTGATQALPGKFEQAQQGTLLLDEISEMPIGLQAKLLRVLQEQEIERLGSRKTVKLNVRVIATSNRNLREAVDEKQFRQDLYYRLHVFPLHCQPLRNRTEDIMPLALQLIEKYGKQYNISSIELTSSAKKKLMNYHWPGNVRELDNVIQRAILLCNKGFITENDLYFDAEEFSNLFQSDVATKNPIKCHQEHDAIIAAFTKHHGNRKLIANELGISIRALRYKLAKMHDCGIDIE